MTQATLTPQEFVDKWRAPLRTMQSTKRSDVADQTRPGAQDKSMIRTNAAGSKAENQTR
jgi:hypothetical protein